MSAAILQFTSKTQFFDLRKNKFTPVSTKQLSARKLLESMRQTRLSDCPYKQPVRVAARLIEDAGVYCISVKNPFGQPEAATWEQIAAVTR
jgi:hypothetical protein